MIAVVRKYADGFAFVTDALNRYHADVVSGEFPAAVESYAMPAAKVTAAATMKDEAVYSTVAGAARKPEASV